MTMKSGALAAMLVMALATCSSAASAQPKPAESLRRAPEAVLFTCAVGAKTVSICGQEQGAAVYRFGRLGRVEIEVPSLHFAQHTFWGGGETQVHAETPTYRYVVHDRMTRTGFDDEGHHLSKMTEGLVVQSERRTALNRECAQPLGREPPAFNQRLLEMLVPKGDYVPH